MNYVDGFVAAVPVANREIYRQYCTDAAAVFREHGALRVVECWQDDVAHGKLTDFFMAVQAKDDEAILFSWIEWPSKEARDSGWAALMADPRMDPVKNPMPFDGKRMIYGGFAPLVDAGG